MRPRQDLHRGGASDVTERGTTQSDIPAWPLGLANPWPQRLPLQSPHPTPARRNPLFSALLQQRPSYLQTLSYQLVSTQNQTEIGANTEAQGPSPGVRPKCDRVVLCPSTDFPMSLEVRVNSVGWPRPIPRLAALLTSGCPQSPVTGPSWNSACPELSVPGSQSTLTARLSF